MAEGRPILSRLDEAALERIAEAGGGRYFRADDPDSLSGLLDQIESFQEEAVQSELSEKRVERFQMFLILAALALFLAEILTDRRLRGALPATACWIGGFRTCWAVGISSYYYLLSCC